MLEKLQQYKQVLVVGLGQTGLSVARFLARHAVPFAVADSRENAPGLDELRQLVPEVEVRCGQFNADFFSQADCLIVSPGVAISHPLIQAAQHRGAVVVGDIEIFAQLAVAPIIAITGSNGKSSVTTLVGMMFEQAGRLAYTGGNLGTPALDLLNQDPPDAYVMELSSFQLETTYSLNAKVATVLNVSEDHMDRYDSFADYVAAKAKIYHGCDFALFNHDDAQVMFMQRTASTAERLYFTQQQLTDSGKTVYGLLSYEGVKYLARGEQALLPVSALKTPGLHNAENALAALALGAACGLDDEPMLAAIQAFTGLPHRTEWVAELQGVSWYNDSKGTNVGATLAALSGMPNKTVLIAGGQGKDADFQPLASAFEHKARALVLMGDDREKLAALAGSIPYVFVESMQEAVTQARQLAQSGDNVLLSPACASFDMFRNYTERGDIFRKLVQELVA